MRKSLNQLFYTGLFIIFTPIFLIVTPIIYVKLANSVESTSNSVENVPVVEKKIVYDTVRVEIKVESAEKNKKENFKKIDPPKLEEPTISVEEKYIPNDSI